MNGDEYIESLKDGRQIYIHGERVEDVTTHPAFRNSVQVDRAAVQRAARPGHQGRADHRDRHRQRRLHAPVLQGAALGRGPRRRPRRDRRVAAADLRLDGAQPRLQGGLPRHLRAQRRLLRAVRGQRAALVQGVAGARVLHEPHAREPAGRPRQGDPRGLRRLHPRGQGDRRGRRRARREDGRHRLGAVELQLRLLPRQRADQEGGVRALLLRADGPPEHQAAVPAVLRVHGRGGRQPVRLPALEPLRRERLGADVRRRADPVGELPDLPQPRDRQHLPPHGVHLAGDAPGLHAPGRQARLPRRRLHQGARGDGDDRLPRHPGQRRRDPRLAQHLLGADRRHVPQPGARRPRAASSPTTRPARPTGSSRTSRSRRSRRSSRTRSPAR